MNESQDKRHGAIVPSALVASAIVALLSIVSVLFVPVATVPLADMHIEPRTGVTVLEDMFTVDVMVIAHTPVNVFRGEVQFDHTKLVVDSIDYNTSVANFWAERPWYENGNGTINFIGGTTQKGGFLGEGSLIQITFRSLVAGEALIRVTDARILEHDGLGTDVPLARPLDALFLVEDSVIDAETIATPESSQAKFAVVTKLSSTDLNGDGKQTIADMSIFMLGMFGNDPRLDFNADGEVDTKDLSIIMSAQ
jgi:hypothetical protein